MTVRRLPPVVGPPSDDPPPGLADDHPMRAVTRAVAFEPDGWNPARRAQVEALFDELAADWSTRDVPGREAPIIDAFARGVTAAPAGPRRLGLDVGAGDGINARHLAPQVEVLVTVDLSVEMLRAAPPSLRRLRADASQLPLADGRVDVLVLANCFLFPAEVPRVLSPTGVLVWVNSRGTGTPIHLSAEEVDRALPDRWDGVSSQAGWGTWSVHWRRADGGSEPAVATPGP